MRHARAYPLAALAGLAALIGCALHGEAALRAGLEDQFYIGDTLYFESKLTCTAAVFRADQNDPRPDFPLFDSLEEAQDTYVATGLAGLRISGKSPHQITDALLATPSGMLGQQALAAAAQVEPCITPAISRGLKFAMTRPGALLAYDRALSGLIVIDPLERKLFFAAGDPI